MIIRLAASLIASGCALDAAQFGALETEDGKRFSGEISFAKNEVTVKTSAGATERFAVADLRHVTFSKDPNHASAELESPRNGLRGRYYSNIKHEGKPVERIDATVSFNWGEARPIDEITQNGFSIRWEGEVESPVAGEITFEVESDDGSRLWVDGQKLIDHWEAQSATAHRGTIKLEANRRYPIKLEYYDAWSDALARLRWKADGIPHQIIPTKHLFPFPLTSPTGEKFQHAVMLKSGSIFEGKITHADTKRVRLATSEGEITFPVPAIGLLRFSQSWGTDLAVLLKKRPPGCALMNRDYVEGKFKGIADGAAKIESVLFGTRTIQRSELRAIKLAEQTRRPVNFLLITTADDFVMVEEITTMPGGKLEIRDSSGYQLTIPAALIRHLRTSMKSASRG